MRAAQERLRMAGRADIRRSTVVAAALLIASTAAHAVAPPWRPRTASLPAPAACFAPGTTQEEIEQQARGHGAEQGSAASAGDRFEVEAASRWTATATDGCCLAQGDPTTITYSFVPDGTPLPSGIGEPASPSNLFAFLNGIYGSPAVWMPLFHNVFARWADLAGVRYVFESTDDGAPVPDAPGALGIRGDVRISGHFINGDGGVIAYNWLPSAGDMVLDTGDGVLRHTEDQSVLLRNVVAHEHGHGIGLGHTCPIDRTKLMEPVAALSFDGPQHDDVIGGQRGYGDPLESGDDSPATAVDLGTLGNTSTTVGGVSIDDDDDVDLFRFTVGSAKRISASVSPIGRTYPQARQGADGSCGAGTSFDSRSQADLAFDLLASDGATVLATADAAPIGAVEQLSAVDLPAAGTYYLRIRASTPDATQLYELALGVGDTVPQSDSIFADGFESGDLSAWKRTRDSGGQLSVGPGAALEGDLGLQISLGSGAASYVVDRSPLGEDRYRARFLLDATSYVPPSSTARVHLLKVYSKTPATRAVVTLSLRMADGLPQIQARVRRDVGGNAVTPFVTMSAAAHAVEIDWRKSSRPGSDDGRLELWIDGRSAAVLDHLDNDQHLVEQVRLGVMAASRSATGILRLDGFESRRRSDPEP
jgi:Matrixin